eukprot:scaffold3195_cov100-Isochrysis_galbana.AAC.10
MHRWEYRQGETAPVPAESSSQPLPSSARGSASTPAPAAGPRRPPRPPSPPQPPARACGSSYFWRWRRGPTCPWRRRPAAPRSSRCQRTCPADPSAVAGCLLRCAAARGSGSSLLAGPTSDTRLK